MSKNEKDEKLLSDADLEKVSGGTAPVGLLGDPGAVPVIDLPVTHAISE